MRKGSGRACHCSIWWHRGRSVQRWHLQSWPALQPCPLLSFLCLLDCFSQRSDNKWTRKNADRGILQSWLDLKSGLSVKKKNPSPLSLVTLTSQSLEFFKYIMENWYVCFWIVSSLREKKTIYQKYLAQYIEKYVKYICGVNINIEILIWQHWREGSSNTMLDAQIMQIVLLLDAGCVPAILYRPLSIPPKTTLDHCSLTNPTHWIHWHP